MGRKHTLIIVRRALAEPKTVLAGEILEIFSARLTVSMAAFSAEMAPSRPSGRWDSAFMVETGGGCERTVWYEGCEEGRKS